jgi:hypothetical protein
MGTGAPQDGGALAPPTWEVVAGATFTATINDPGGLTAQMGMRVETPVNRAIAANWLPATLSNVAVAGPPGDAWDAEVTLSQWTVTQVAPLAPGAYLLAWMTSEATPPQYETFVPLIVVDQATYDSTTDFPAIDQTQVTPTVDDVATLERSRTLDQNGNDQGTFTATTFPATATDVQKIITDAASAVLGQLPDSMDPLLYDRIKWAIKLQAAILVETSFFRVQAGVGNAAAGLSNVASYTRMLALELANLQNAAGDPGLGLRLA